MTEPRTQTIYMTRTLAGDGVGDTDITAMTQSLDGLFAVFGMKSASVGNVSYGDDSTGKSVSLNVTLSDADGPDAAAAIAAAGFEAPAPVVAAELEAVDPPAEAPVEPAVEAVPEPEVVQPAPEPEAPPAVEHEPAVETPPEPEAPPADTIPAA